MAYVFNDDMSKSPLERLFKTKRLYLSNSVTIPWNNSFRKGTIHFPHGLSGSSTIIGLRRWVLDKPNSLQTAHMDGWWYDSTNIIVDVENTYGSPVTIRGQDAGNNYTYVEVVYLE